MKATKWLVALAISLLSVLGCSHAVASQCAVGETTHAVKQGETLSGIVGKSWKAYADAKGLKSPYTIRIGQELCVSQGSRAKALPLFSVDPVRIIDLGRAPSNRYGDAATRDKLIDLSPLLSLRQKAEAKKLFREGRCEKRLITQSMLWQAMPFQSKDGTIKFARNVRVRDAEHGGKVEVACFATLSDGTIVGNPLSCGNISPVIMPKSQVVVPAETPPEPVVPPSKGEVAPALIAPPVAPAGPCSNLDPKGVVGGEYERNMSAHFASAGLYCLWRGEGGSHGVGGGMNISVARGTVATSGAFKTKLAVGGPGYEFISDDNWDIGLRVNFGWLEESFREGGFASGRDGTVWGPSVEVNNSQRRARGEKWFAKTQVFAMYLLPLSMAETRTWNGTALPAGQKFSSYFNAGVRQYIYDGEQAHVYGQLGFLQEGSDVRTMNVRLGVADPDEIVGVHAGFDKDLKNGGTFEPAIGWWVDGVQGVRVHRNGIRQAQFKAVADEQGITLDSGLTLE
jgi:hypothetical protein